MNVSLIKFLMFLFLQVQLNDWNAFNLKWKTIFESSFIYGTTAWPFPFYLEKQISIYEHTDTKDDNVYT